jgi:hypothetical protein
MAMVLSVHYVGGWGDCGIVKSNVNKSMSVGSWRIGEEAEVIRELEAIYRVTPKHSEP